LMIFTHGPLHDFTDCCPSYKPDLKL
jgi:hypothetical protein